MEEVTLSEVKPWLRNSNLYRTLKSEEEEEEEDKVVLIPSKYYLKSPKYDTVEETNKTLQVCNYWDVDYFPLGAVKFIYECEDQDEIDFLNE